jgi:hypothetical protein
MWLLRIFHNQPPFFVLSFAISDASFGNVEILVAATQECTKRRLFEAGSKVVQRWFEGCLLQYILYHTQVEVDV